MGSNPPNPLRYATAATCNMHAVIHGYRVRLRETVWISTDPSIRKLCQCEPPLLLLRSMSLGIFTVKAQRLVWFGHVHHKPDNSMVKKVYDWSPVLTKSLGRPKNRWEDDVQSDITRMKITNWKDRIRDRTKWKTRAEEAKTSLKL